MTRKFTLFLFTLLIAIKGFSQPMCGTDVKYQQLISSNPAYAAAIQQSNAKWAQLNQMPLSTALIVNTANGPVYQIPVVVHIMNTGGAVGSMYNPLDAQIISMIDYLNRTYSATWTSYPDTNNGGVKIPIQFKLALRDPNCNATTGITRVTVSNTAYVSAGVNTTNTGAGISDAILKDFERWPVSDYYNIWVVNKIDGQDGTSGTFTAGFAYLPPAPYNLDGCIMLATQAIAGQETLPHEVGHSLGLHHVFEGGSVTTCPTNNNCATDGDLVCDTEPQMQSNFNCPTGINPCTGVAYNNGPHNIMDYSSCKDRFTAGQRTRMLTLLPTYRAGLMSSLGATAPAATTMATASCTPTLTATGNGFDVGPANVTFSDMTAGSLGGYTSDGNLVYMDRTCVQTAHVVIGQTYTISVSTLINPQNVRVYIDYDNNGVFNTTNELVYSHNSTQASGAETHTGSITIPATAGLACTYRRMRVVSDISSNTTLGPCTALVDGQAEDYSVYFKAAASTATVAATLTNGTNPTCSGSSLTFTATPSATALTPTYKWYVNGVFTGTTTTTYTTTTLANNSIVNVEMFYTTATGCGADSAFSNSITITSATTAPASVTIALTGGTNPTCAGQALTFTATPTNGGTTPTYQWRQNGLAVAGATNATYTTSTYTNNTVITVAIVSNSSCASPATATSNGITISVGTVALTPSVTIALTSGTNSSCPGTALTFTATPTNGGTAPQYQWKINGVAVTGATGATFSTTLVNAASVTVTMLSNNPCVATSVNSVTSNAIVETATYVTPSVTTAVTHGTNPGCVGDTLTFTATPTNGGTAPTYQWKINGVAVSGATNASYTTSTLTAGAIVTVTTTSNDACVNPSAKTATSSDIVISNATLAPSVTIALSGGSTNPDCKGKIINFLATPSSAGTTPTYTWKVNGVTIPGFTTNVFSTATLNNGDSVSVVVTSSSPCSFPTTGTSPAIVMGITPLDTPGVAITYLAGSNPGCADSLFSVTAAAVTPGGTVASYAWYLNNVLVSSTAAFSSTTLLDGDVLNVQIVISGTGCRVSDTAKQTINIVRYAAPLTPVISFISSWLVANSSSPVQWYGPNGIIAGADSIGYHPSAPGNYYCYALNNGCPSLKSNILNVSLLDVASIKNATASVYPNPTTGELVIDWGKNVRNVSIDVYSATGQKLLHQTADNTASKAISLKSFANGNYFIVTHDGDGNTTTTGVTVSK